jgi:predicted DNA-binding protein with PD1-like motif
MNESAAASTELTFGRVFLGRLLDEADLLRAIQAFCQQRRICAGLFSLTGSTRSAIVGTYDAKQQVYATRKESGTLEIVHCTGSLLPGENAAVPEACIVLCHENGALTGGRLFSGTPVDTGEFEIRELVGTLPRRIFDPLSGRMRMAFL